MLTKLAQKIRTSVEFFPPRRVFAGELHREILSRFGYRGGTFFEAGANDGLSQSNTAYIGRHLDWTGILVEPIPHKAESCRRNRADAETFEAALVPFSYAEPDLEIVFSNLMSISPLSAIPIAQHLDRSRAHIRGEVALFGRPYRVPARTAQSIIDEAGNPEIDLFILDVEGAERSVIEGIDFTRTRPRNMLIEVRDLPAMVTLMASKGYGPPERLRDKDYLFAAH